MFNVWPEASGTKKCSTHQCSLQMQQHEKMETLWCQHVRAHVVPTSAMIDIDISTWFLHKSGIQNILCHLFFQMEGRRKSKSANLVLSFSEQIIDLSFQRHEWPKVADWGVMDLAWVWHSKKCQQFKKQKKMRLLQQCTNNVPMESSKKEQEQEMSHDWSSVQLEEHQFVKCGKWHQKKHWGNKTSWKKRSMLKNTRKTMWGKVNSEEETKCLSVTENAMQKMMTTKKNLAKPRVDSGIKCACNPWIQFLWRQVVHHPSCLMGKGGLICLPCGSHHNRVCFIVRSKWSGNRSNEEHSKGQTS